MDLPRPANKLTSLQLFHDTITSHVRCLQSLSKSPTLLETLLVSMILTKLPEETKKNMARDHQSTTWTIEELQAAILKELRIFKVGQQTSTLTNHQAIPTTSFYTGAKRKTGHTHRDTTNRLSRAYCKGNHSANNCNVNKDVPLRLEVIKKKHLCICPSAPQKTAAAHAVENTTICNEHNKTTDTPPTRRARIRSTRAVIHLQPLMLIL